MSVERTRPQGAWAASLALGVVGVLLSTTGDAWGQGPRLEITASGGRWGGYGLGIIGPSITGPQAPTGSPVLVLHSEVAVRPGAAADVRVAWRVWRHLYAEATGGIGRNTLEARIRDDIEQAPALTVSAALTQVTVEGGTLAELAGVPMPAGKLVVFAAGGGGYLRQVHEDRVLIESGSTAYVGGGVKWRTAAARPKGLIQRLVLRGDVRLVSRAGGVDIEDARRSYITVSGGVGLRLF
jgi:hypothetical protein